MNSAALLIVVPVAAILVALLIYCYSHPHMPDQEKALAPERGDAGDLQPGDSLDDFEDDGGFAYERASWERAQHKPVAQNWRNN